VGHLAIALEVRHTLALDEVWFVVAGDPWQKSEERSITPAAIRLAMVEAAVAGAPGVQVSTMEIDRDGPSYTADTLTNLTAAYPNDTFHLIIGSDAAAGLDTWHRPDVVAALARVVVVDRGGDSRSRMSQCSRCRRRTCGVGSPKARRFGGSSPRAWRT
jgi:nicotinate-nucleotide adenylyltransferase